MTASRSASKAASCSFSGSAAIRSTSFRKNSFFCASDIVKYSWRCLSFIFLSSVCK
nr:MAG TPA: hypothetical protein [Caudoviricetes sp.]